jgi:hypothetical protein
MAQEETQMKSVRELEFGRLLKKQDDPRRLGLTKRRDGPFRYRNGDVGGRCLPSLKMLYFRRVLKTVDP